MKVGSLVLFRGASDMGKKTRKKLFKLSQYLCLTCCTSRRMCSGRNSGCGSTRNGESNSAINFAHCVIGLIRIIKSAFPIYFVAVSPSGTHIVLLKPFRISFLLLQLKNLFVKFFPYGSFVLFINFLPNLQMLRTYTNCRDLIY